MREAAEGHIQILPPEEARRIAAGEVVDRPSALIREFMDNAIDSGATAIEVSVEGGGSKKAEVSDNGCGMGKNDLELCWLAHATSKIRRLDDLSTAETLGFRGEALAAAAAVARLEIVSSTGIGEAWRMEVGPGENPLRITATVRTKGSTVRAVNLFDTIPVRKQFLKRDSSEAALCRQVFIEKALAFPPIEFRFIRDGKPQDFFPAVDSKEKRFAAALLDTAEAAFLHEIHVSGEGFSADIVIGGPELFRYDRRMMYIFANGRRIQEYSLTQAMEYGVQGWFPNGTHPAGAVFINIDPALVDFNIHPAKREVRFRDSGSIHHAVSSGLRNFYHHHSLKKGPEERANAAVNENFNFDAPAVSAQRNDYRPQPDYHPLPDLDKIRKIFNEGDSIPQSYGTQAAEAVPVYSTGEIRFAGRAFGLFILAEWNDRLFIIDQHAAHERILYNRFISTPIPKQELLVPIVFTAESAEDDRFLDAKREELTSLAVEINKDGGAWRIDSLPAGWKLSDTETVKAILGLRDAGENIAARWIATLCCHQAVRDGSYLDDTTALTLAREALALPDPHCPHGRPVLTEISREALYKAVRRI